MQHLFEFYIKHKDEQHAIHSHYVTETSRLNKVAKKIVEQVNKLRAAVPLSEWKREDFEDFKIRKLR